MKPYLTFALLIFALNVFGQNALTDSLVAYYPFNGNANDASGNGNNGTSYGATLTTDRFGNPNSAYYFNGISDYIIYQSNKNFKPATFPISITAWIKSSLNDGEVAIFDNDHTDDIYGGVNLNIGYNSSTSGNLTLTFGDGVASGPGDRVSKSASFNINDNQWHFIAGVIRSPTDMDLFIDCNYLSGTYSGSAQQFAYTNSGGLAGTNNSSTSPIYYYRGSIGETRLYHRSLAQSDLQAIYSYPQPYNSNLTVSLGPDTMIGCIAGSSIVLNPDVQGNPISYKWSNNSTSPAITVTQPGNYALTVYDGCNYSSDTVDVTLSPGGQAGTIISSRDTICGKTGFTSLLTTDGSFGTLQWQSSTDQVHFSSIPGATSVSYSTPANMNQTTFFRVFAQNNNCADTSDAVAVHFIPAPIVTYTYIANGNKVTFNINGSSPSIISYYWDFGDSTSSTSPDPIHDFKSLDTFYVCLTGYNGSDCLYTFCMNFDLLSGIPSVSENNIIQLYPNPADNAINLSTGELQGRFQLRIYNVLGQQVQAINDLNFQDKQTIPIELNDIPAGAYQLILSGNNNFYSKSFVHFN